MESAVHFCNNRFACSFILSSVVTLTFKNLLLYQLVANIGLDGLERNGSNGHLNFKAIYGSSRVPVVIAGDPHFISRTARKVILDQTDIDIDPHPCTEGVPSRISHIDPRLVGQ